MIFKKGDLIGQKYQLYDIIGEGGFGTVYLVYSLDAKAVCVLKSFKEEYVDDPDIRERFNKEAQVWVALEKHPYIVKAYCLEKISGRLFIAMEYIASDELHLNSLDQYLKHSPPDWLQSLRWAIQFCYGMEYAYSRGISAHRDIKPSNIMISQDKTVKISDFGLAGLMKPTNTPFILSRNTIKRNSVLAYHTIVGTALGTPAYMSPEQFISPAKCNEKSDLYSFGIVLYQMATGGAFPYQISEKYLKEEQFKYWFNLHSEAPILKIDSPLFPIVKRCLEKNPDRRYQSFREMRGDIEILLLQKSGEFFTPLEKKELEAWEWANKGVSLNILGKYEEAITCFNEVLQHNPKDTYALVGKGASFEFLGKYQEALDYYEQVLAIDTFHEFAWNNKGTCLGRMGNDVEAIACFDRLLKINNKNPLAWNNKGCKLAKLEKYQEELDCYDKAIELDPYYDDAWFNRGNNLVKAGKSIEALDAYYKVVEINPYHGRAWVCIGVIFTNNKEYQKAIECYDKALKIDPTNVNALELKSYALLDIGKSQETLACLEAALVLDSTRSILWYSKGVCLGKLCNYKEAIKSYDQALKLNPKYVNALTNKGIILVQLKKYKDALESFTRCSELSPKDPDVWFNKAVTEDKLNNKENVVNSFKIFIELSSSRDDQRVKYARQRIKKIEDATINIFNKIFKQL